jgi:capsular polysaccharide biosynthesis protein
MAIRKLSSRYLSWAALSSATRALPSLKRAMPLTDRVMPLIEGGRIQCVTEQQPVPLTPEEAEYAKLLPDPPPPVIERSIALVELRNATVLGNTGAVMDERSDCVFQSRYSAARYKRGLASYHDFRAAPSRLIDKPDANYFHMVGEYRGHRHYFHFLFDRLPRIHYLLSRFTVGRENIVVLMNESPPPFQLEIYGFLAARYPNLEFVAVPERERWRLPKLYVIDEDQPVRRTLLGADMVKFIRDLVFEGFGIAPSRPTRRLYVTRSDTPKRRIINEGAIWPLFAARGFEKIEAAKLSFRDQVATFAQAEAIAGPHGAGFANMLWALPGTRILEISNREKVKNTFFLLAKSLGQQHHAVIGGEGDRNEWFRADPAAIEATLQSMFDIPSP